MRKTRIINIDLDEIEIKEAIQAYLKQKGIESDIENIYLASSIAINNGIVQDIHPTQCYVESAKEYIG